MGVPILSELKVKRLPKIEVTIIINLVILEKIAEMGEIIK